MSVRSLSEGMIGIPVFGHHDWDIGLAEALDHVDVRALGVDLEQSDLSGDLAGLPKAGEAANLHRKGVGKPEAGAHGVIDQAVE